MVPCLFESSSNADSLASGIPGIDGLETYRRLLRHHPRQKAVITSGFAETDRVRQAQSLGAGAYIKKPYTVEALGTAIRSELAKTA